MKIYQDEGFYYAGIDSRKIGVLSEDFEYDSNAQKILIKSENKTVFLGSQTPPVDLMDSEYEYGDAIRADSKRLFLSPSNT